MKPVYLIAAAVLASGALSAGMAQSRIYRCGNEYTNSPPASQKNNCTLVEGGNVTVIEGTRPQANSPAPSAGGGSRVVTAPPPGAPPRIDNADQRARDNDARGILESELRKAELRHTELQKEYNGGAPERIAGEIGNDLRYQTRIADLKAGIERIESDLAGIRRELGRATPR